MLAIPGENTNQNGNATRQSLGKVIFSKTEKYTQSLNGDKIYGFIREENKEMVSKGDSVVLFHRELPLKFYAIVIRIDNYPITAGGYEKHITEVGTHVELRPFLEVEPSEGYRGTVRPHDLTEFEIGFPNHEELGEINNVPKEGLPLGSIHGNGARSTFYYPLKPEDTIFQSMLVAGVQGSGKTNFNKLLIQALSSKTETAIIVLDAEGEYQQFTKIKDMNEEGRHFLMSHHINEVNLQVLKLSNDLFRSSASLSVQGINLTDILQLLPELEPKSADVLTAIAFRAQETLRQRSKELTWKNLRDEILQEVNTTQYLNGMAGASIKQAIGRALISLNLRLFDQPGKIPLNPQNVFKRGVVTIIDYQELSVQQQRMVALTLLLMIYKFKFQDNNREPGVLLFIDEAELLFPAKPSNVEKDYVDRIEEKMREPVKRGRKHRYGIVPITHLPSDVSSGVTSLCNTKIAFRCSGARPWIRQNFGKEFINEIERLATGSCRINTEKTSVQMNLTIAVPFVGNPSELQMS
jgi:hypothetical protein